LNLEISKMVANAARAITRDVQSYVTKYCKYQQSILTIEQFTHFGKTASPKESYKFLRHEVPIRLAHIMQEISHLPKNLLTTPSVRMVSSWYVQSFNDLLNFHEEDKPSEDVLSRFTTTLLNIKRRHDNTVETMAQGIIELRESEGEGAILPAVQYFLDRFYMNRIGIRLLMTQHLALFEKDLSKSSKSRFIGVFEPDCVPKTVVMDAVENAGLLCDQFYFDSPGVTIKEHNSVEAGKEIIQAYVPSHLYFMLFELIKNAMRATVETHSDLTELPKLEIDIVKGKEDLTIRVTDYGGGIKRQNMDSLFAYHYSTAPQPDRDFTIAPLAGYGYGLPLSRLYAKYFGGDIQITSMEGLGTSAHIYLKALSADAHEVIPMYNSSVARHYEEENQPINGPREWTCDSFYDGQVSSYAKPKSRTSLRQDRKIHHSSKFSMDRWMKTSNR